MADKNKLNNISNDMDVDDIDVDDIDVNFDDDEKEAVDNEGISQGRGRREAMDSGKDSDLNQYNEEEGSGKASTPVEGGQDIVIEKWEDDFSDEEEEKDNAGGDKDAANANNNNDVEGDETTGGGNDEIDPIDIVNRAFGNENEENADDLYANPKEGDNAAGGGDTAGSFENDEDGGVDVDQIDLEEDEEEEDKLGGDDVEEEPLDDINTDDFVE